MTRLFSFSPSLDNEHTSHTCSDTSFSGHHPQCIVECGFCNPGMKPPHNCITHSNLKNILKFGQGNHLNSAEAPVPNKLCKVTENNVKIIKANRSATPTLQQVKVSPDPKGLPLLNNIR